MMNAGGRRRHIPGGAANGHNQMPSRSEIGGLVGVPQVDGEVSGLLAKKKPSNGNTLGSYLPAGGSPMRDSENGKLG